MPTIHFLNVKEGDCSAGESGIYVFLDQRTSKISSTSVGQRRGIRSRLRPLGRRYVV